MFFYIFVTPWGAENKKLKFNPGIAQQISRVLWFIYNTNVKTHAFIYKCLPLKSIILVKKKHEIVLLNLYDVVSNDVCW